MSPIDRRSFLAAAAGAVPILLPARLEGAPRQAARRPAAIGSGNAREAIARAVALMEQGRDVLEAVVEGIAIVEDDPSDNSVGYGGLPNEEGVVELDASVMHGPMCAAGAVAALQNVKNPSRVALEVMRRTDHVLLVGEGALAFARALGFPEQDLLTPESREAWLKWKASLNRNDDWLDLDQQADPARGRGQPRPRTRGGSGGSQGGVPWTHGTIHISAMDAAGDLGACTSTSGLSWKLPGRVGDSPLIGAGTFVDNAVGSAGSTGRGEAVIQSCGAFQVVRNMAEGMEPQAACLKVLKWIAEHTVRPDLLNDRGEPNFDVTMYALRKDGATGAASLRGADRYSFYDGKEVRSEKAVTLY